MKKILSFMFAVLFVASLFAMTASAAVTKKARVVTELEDLYIGGEQFDEAKYPVDKNRDDIEILAVSEMGFHTLTTSSNYGLFIYIYNPSCMKFDNSPNNTVQIGLNLDSRDYSFYGLELMSRSDDHRFYKYKVVGYGNNAASELYQQQEKVAERVYNVPVVRLSSGNMLKAYPIKKVYFFSGYESLGTLTCSVRDAEVIGVKLHDTTWVSPNAGHTFSGKEVDKYDHYEVHSVYFAIDRTLYDQYDYLSSIKASYEARKLTPIVVTRPGKLSSETVDAIQTGKNVSSSETDIDDLAAIRNYASLDILYEVDWWYSETNINFGNYEAGNRYDQLVYLFENDKLPEDFNFNGVNSMLGFTSNALRNRYYELVGKGFHHSLLYSETSGPKEINYRSSDMFHLKKYEQNLSGIAKWWDDLFTKNDSYLYDDFNIDGKVIEVIRDPSAYANINSNSYKQYGDQLYINECDMKAFTDFCKTAAESDQVVVILRYAVSDYRCVPVYDVAEFTGSLWGLGLDDQKAVSIEKSAYFNVSVAQIGFTTNGVEVIVPVASNVVDSFGDGIVYEDPNDKNGLLPGDGDFDWEKFWNDLLGKLKGIGITVAIVAIVVVIVWITPPVVRAFSAVGSARRQRKREKKADQQSNKRKE